MWITPRFLSPAQTSEGIYSTVNLTFPLDIPRNLRLIQNKVIISNILPNPNLPPILCFLSEKTITNKHLSSFQVRNLGVNIIFVYLILFLFTSTSIPHQQDILSIVFPDSINFCQFSPRFLYPDDNLLLELLQFFPYLSIFIQILIQLAFPTFQQYVLFKMCI